MKLKSSNLFSNKNKWKTITILVVAVLLILACSFMIESMIWNESNAEEVLVGAIDIPGYEKLSFKAGLKEQSVNFLNPKENDCYFQISLLMEDGTVLWKSNIIKPGEKIHNLQLNQELKTGTYSAIIKYDCFSIEDKSALNGAEVKIKLDVV